MTGFTAYGARSSPSAGVPIHRPLLPAAGKVFRSSALAVRNLGPAITFIDESDPLPLTVAAATAWRWRALTASVETSRARGADAVYRAGVEAVLYGALALRSGYLARAEMDDAVTFGLGIIRGAIVIDYAYVPVHEIADTHHVGVSLWF